MYKYSNSAMGGKGSSFIHYPNGEIQELTGSPLYHTATIINSNIHSGGVSLQQTKEERYTIISCNFYVVFQIIEYFLLVVNTINQPLRTLSQF